MRDDNFEIVMDFGCSKSISPCTSNFVPGSLVDLPTPLAMDGIAGQLIAHQRGRLQYEILNDAGGVTILECNGYHLPDLKIWLFSPQVMLAENQSRKIVLEWDKSCLEMANGDVIPIGITNIHLSPLSTPSIMSWPLHSLLPWRGSLNTPPQISLHSSSNSLDGIQGGAILDGSMPSGLGAADLSGSLG
jgi:hypothetical protein